MKSVLMALRKPLDVSKLLTRHPQGWIDNKQSIRHREMLSRLFSDAAVQGRLGEIDPSYIYGLLQIAVRCFLFNLSQLHLILSAVSANVVFCSSIQAGSTTIIK